MFELPTKMSSLDARYEAQKIAFGPVVFQVARTLRNTGLLMALDNVAEKGFTIEEAMHACDLKRYAVVVLFEGGLSAKILKKTEDRWSISPVGRFLLHDELTRVNMDFVQDVCYRGLVDFDRSVVEEHPHGLREFGDNWSSIYEALQFLPEPAKTSWFAFDHFYSDATFPELLKTAFSSSPKRLLDIGGNTGKWALKCLKHNPDVEVTIADLPETLKRAVANIGAAGFGDRLRSHPMNLLQLDAPLPKGFDVVWMSQFLCCFSEEQVTSILTRARAALNPGGRILINDTFWDRQEHEIAAYCIINSSPYFTAMANGNSKMYSAEDMLRMCKIAGLTLLDATDGIGYGHTVFTFTGS